jgi:hypothetical protein
MHFNKIRLRHDTHRPLPVKELGHMSTPSLPQLPKLSLKVIPGFSVNVVRNCKSVWKIRLFASRKRTKPTGI